MAELSPEGNLDRPTVSIMQACQVTGVTRRTIYNWIQSDKVDYIRTAGGSVRIFKDTLFKAPAKVEFK